MRLPSSPRVVALMPLLWLACDRDPVPAAAPDDTRSGAAASPAPPPAPAASKTPAPAPAAAGPCALSRTLAGHTKPVVALAFGDGIVASASFDHTIRVWETGDWGTRHVLEGHIEAVRSAAFLPDGRTLVSGGGDDTVRLWDAAGGELSHTFMGQYAAMMDRKPRPSEGHRASVRALAATANAVYSGANDGTVRLWDVGKKRHVVRIDHGNHYISSVAVDPSERWLAFGNFDHQITIWDIARRRVHHTFSYAAGDEYGEELVFLSSDVLASAGGDGRLRTWSIKSKQKLAEVDSGHGAVLRLIATADALYSGHSDGHVAMWSREPVAMKGAFQAASADVAALAGRGTTLVTGDYTGATVKVWTCATAGS